MGTYSRLKRAMGVHVEGSDDEYTTCKWHGCTCGGDCLRMNYHIQCKCKPPARQSDKVLSQARPAPHGPTARAANYAGFSDLFYAADAHPDHDARFRNDLCTAIASRGSNIDPIAPGTTSTPGTNCFLDIRSPRVLTIYPRVAIARKIWAFKHRDAHVARIALCANITILVPAG
ncbi:hypothetical protein BV22DRAFT_1126594 [Leucogyrophana mollusca]|uniref:Uncharacterized protein n=1 Tax=Leucogyrophana mollusca TaxID=85980 RepID=A0ACB8BTT7_9AGAM|nr:hypothetical protein BV22DRAFT_1126594 [Leucogyrophana mollusca]